jgi:hypothetical protein
VIDTVLDADHAVQYPTEFLNPLESSGMPPHNLMLKIGALVTPFDFKRLQFPVRLAFAMLISKAQGQSRKVAGINLETPYFSHGQLYVACTRVGTGKICMFTFPMRK